MTFQEKYKPYNNWLVENTGIDWWELQKKYNTLGNAPGVYPDSLMLLCKVAMRDEVKTIVELGSGSSTIYLQKVCQDLGKTFISFEELTKYHEMTQKLCNFYGLKPNMKVLTEEWDIPSCDFIWIDCGIEKGKNFGHRFIILILLSGTFKMTLKILLIRFL